MKTTTIAKQLHAEAFSYARDPRSDAYKAGHLAALVRKLEAGPSKQANPYQLGTSDSDAFWAGWDEGLALANEAEKKGHAT